MFRPLHCMANIDIVGIFQKLNCYDSSIPYFALLNQLLFLISIIKNYVNKNLGAV